MLIVHAGIVLDPVLVALRDAPPLFIGGAVGRVEARFDVGQVQPAGEELGFHAGPQQRDPPVVVLLPLTQRIGQRGRHEHGRTPLARDSQAGEMVGLVVDGQTVAAVGTWDGRAGLVGHGHVADHGPFQAQVAPVAGQAVAAPAIVQHLGLEGENLSAAFDRRQRHQHVVEGLAVLGDRVALVIFVRRYADAVMGPGLVAGQVALAQGGLQQRHKGDPAADAVCFAPKGHGDELESRIGTLDGALVVAGPLEVLVGPAKGVLMVRADLNLDVEGVRVCQELTGVLVNRFEGQVGTGFVGAAKFEDAIARCGEGREVQPIGHAVVIVVVLPGVSELVVAVGALAAPVLIAIFQPVVIAVRVQRIGLDRDRFALRFARHAVHFVVVAQAIVVRILGEGARAQAQLVAVGQAIAVLVIPVGQRRRRTDRVRMIAVGQRARLSQHAGELAARGGRALLFAADSVSQSGGINQRSKAGSQQRHDEDRRQGNGGTPASAPGADEQPAQGEEQQAGQEPGRIAYCVLREGLGHAQRVTQYAVRGTRRGAGLRRCRRIEELGRQPLAKSRIVGRTSYPHVVRILAPCRCGLPIPKSISPRQVEDQPRRQPGLAEPQFACAVDGRAAEACQRHVADAKLALLREHVTGDVLGIQFEADAAESRHELL